MMAMVIHGLKAALRRTSPIPASSGTTTGTACTAVVYHALVADFEALHAT
jgi:hypothetical protein